MKQYSLKMMIAGQGAVGKTSLVRQYVERFSTADEVDYKMTIGVEPMSKIVELEDYTARISIFDLGGQARFSFTRKGLYRGAHAVMYVYDLTRPNTLYELVNWFHEHEENNSGYDNCVAILIGNKADLTQMITDEAVSAFLNENPEANIIYSMKTSALHNINVDEAFTYLVKKTIEKIE